MRGDTKALITAGFAVALGVAIAIGMAKGITSIILFGSTPRESQTEAMAFASLDGFLSIGRPFMLILPTIIGIRAFVKAGDFKREYGRTPHASRARTLAALGPIITIATLLLFAIPGGMHAAAIGGAL